MKTNKEEIMLTALKMFAERGFDAVSTSMIAGGLQRAVENALRNSGKFIPWQVVTISRNGLII